MKRLRMKRRYEMSQSQKKERPQSQMIESSSGGYEWVPDDEDGGGGGVVRRRVDHGDLSGLPGLQQQTQDTLSLHAIHILTRLHANKGQDEGSVQ